jgi:hypothetical protein
MNKALSFQTIQDLTDGRFEIKRARGIFRKRRQGICLDPWKD